MPPPPAVADLPSRPECNPTNKKARISALFYFGNGKRLFRIERAQNARPARAGDGRKIPGLSSQKTESQPGETAGFHLIGRDSQLVSFFDGCLQPCRLDLPLQAIDQEAVMRAAAAQVGILRRRRMQRDGLRDAAGG